jgi:hypothetical protein
MLVIARGIGEEVGNNNDLVTVRAGSSWAKAAHKNSAVVTTLLPEESPITLWALVDDRRLW